jgi:anti-anti-sigma regulatory factor
MPQDNQPSEPSLTHATDEQTSPVLSLDPSGRAVLTLRGEQDILTVVTARRRLLEGIGFGTGHVIMELHGTAADESLIGLIVLALRLTRHAGGTVCVVTDDQILARKLRTTGLDQMISHYAMLQDVPDPAQ